LQKTPIKKAATFVVTALEELDLFYRATGPCFAPILFRAAMICFLRTIRCLILFIKGLLPFNKPLREVGVASTISTLLGVTL
jgi:hypothetical protein